MGIILIRFWRRATFDLPILGTEGDPGGAACGVSANALPARMIIKRKEMSGRVINTFPQHAAEESFAELAMQRSKMTGTI